MTRENREKKRGGEQLFKIFKKMGACCGCGTREGVRNIICLNRKCVIPGHGWGCLVCGLPADGAVAVLCDECLELFKQGKDGIRWACKGRPWEGRIQVGDLIGIHEHDLKIHDRFRKGIGSLN